MKWILHAFAISGLAIGIYMFVTAHTDFLHLLGLIFVLIGVTGFGFAGVIEALQKLAKHRD